ncbi:hypothetical protein [Pseudoxanthomonas mexicana]|uniref:hypothetical protein n=1 Tax=Pseudoxanthomonas mexicana TaxID=128785 RepID=UPI000781B3DB|nr:hypothetical protein [Pseudoxanthomonas mexicana]
MAGVRLASVAKWWIALVLIVTSALGAAYLYRAWLGARVAQQSAVDELAAESRNDMETLRGFMRLSPAMLECTPDETSIMLVEMGCGTGGAIRVRLGSEGEAVFEANNYSFYRVSGGLHRQHRLSLSVRQRDRLRDLVHRWPRSIPEGRHHCSRLPSFPEAIAVCDGGRFYGIDEGDGCPSDVLGPAGELLDALDASIERDPSEAPIICL